MADASTAFSIVKINLCLAIAALQLSAFLDPQFGAGTTASAEAPLLHIAAEVLPPLTSAAVLFLAVTLTYGHLTVMGRPVSAVPVDGAGNGRRWISGSGLLMFVLCVSVGTLEFIVFGKAAGGGAADHGAQARALGLTALHALPTAATGTFFSGMMLMIIVAHVRTGGEGGGGGGGAVAGDGRIQGLLRLLIKVAAAAAAALAGLMAMALTLYGAKPCFQSSSDLGSNFVRRGWWWCRRWRRADLRASAPPHQGRGRSGGGARRANGHGSHPLRSEPSPDTESMEVEVLAGYITNRGSPWGYISISCSKFQHLHT